MPLLQPTETIIADAHVVTSNWRRNLARFCILAAFLPMECSAHAGGVPSPRADFQSSKATVRPQSERRQAQFLFDQDDSEKVYPFPS